MAQFLISQLNIPSKRNETVHEPSSDSHTTESHRTLPLIQSGIVADHHRPYAEYGHLDRETIAKECKFNLQVPSSSSSSINTRSFRMNTKSFAITSWTNVSKELVLDEIKRKFNIENIQYICISEEISELNHQRHLHIQIILKNKVNIPPFRPAYLSARPLTRPPPPQYQHLVARV
ncbi:unnamed protein product, partial [Rotaria sp. Silwood2]